jgi:ABC-type oligopeptide transport system substrate-binding subunit
MVWNAQETRTISRRAMLGGMAAGAATLLASCTFGGGDDDSEGGGGSKTATLRRAVPLAVDSLDPHFNNAGSFVTPSGLLEGLVAQNDVGKGVVPAIAASWTVSDDQLTYTFRIRPEAKFSNGDKITANDFEWTFKRLLTPTGAGGGGTTGANSYAPGLGIKNATTYLSGTLKDWGQVGIQAKDAQTLILQLDSPNPDFLIGLTAFPMMLLHPPTVKKHPKSWMQPANWVGSGPFVLTSWNPTASLEMKAHDHYWDKKNVFLGKVRIRVIPDAPAALLAYKNNEIDVNPAQVATYVMDPALVKQSKQAKGYSVDYLQTMYSKHPASADVRVRQALSLAIDRQTLAKIQKGADPGTSLVPNSVPGWSQELATPYDPDRARALLADAGSPGGKGMPVVQILDHQTRPVSDAIAQMWKRELGIKVKENIVDLGVFSTVRFQPIKDRNLMGFYYGAFGGVPTFNNWLNTFWGPSVMQQFSLPADAAEQYQKVQADTSLAPSEQSARLAAILSANASPEAKKFAADVVAARKTPDADERNAKFLAAAKLREQLYEVLPLLWQSQSFLVKPAFSGVHIRTTPEAFYFKGVRKG